MTSRAADRRRTPSRDERAEARPLEPLTAAIERLSFGLVAITALAVDGATTRHSLTFQQWRVLVVVGRTEDGVRISQLAERIGASAPSASRLVRRLIAKDMLTVETDPDDRRAMRVRLSAAGGELRRRVIERRRALIVATISGAPARWIPADGVETLADAFEPFV
jgi:DNA-binding MarR family transcriptional regulator